MSVLQFRPASRRAAVTTEQGGFAPMPVPGDLLSLTCWQAEIATEPATVPDANLDRSLLVRLADDLLPLGQIEVPVASALWLDLGRVVASVRPTASAETHVPWHAPGSGSRSCWPERRQRRGRGGADGGLHLDRRHRHEMPGGAPNRLAHERPATAVRLSGHLAGVAQW
jgi:hypothetical protein